MIARLPFAPPDDPVKKSSWNTGTRKWWKNYFRDFVLPEICRDPGPADRLMGGTMDDKGFVMVLTSAFGKQEVWAS